MESGLVIIEDEPGNVIDGLVRRTEVTTGVCVK